MAQMGRYGTEGEVKKIILCLIFACEFSTERMVPNEKVVNQDLLSMMCHCESMLGMAMSVSREEINGLIRM